MDGASLPFDEVMALCQDKHRRIVLATFTAQRRTLTMNDLAKTIAKHNHQRALTELSDETVTQIRTGLSHVHLPKLKAAGIVEWTPERQPVEPTEQLDRIEPALSAILDADPELTPPLEL